MTHAQVTAARIASPEWQRDPIWTSPTLRRMSAEAVWDRATYEALKQSVDAPHIASRARRRQGHSRPRMAR